MNNILRILIFGCVVLGITLKSFSFATEKKVLVEEILERFYEETGKNYVIEDIDIFISNPLPITKLEAKDIADILAVSTETAHKIINLSKSGLGFDAICDSLGLLSSQCDLLRVISKVDDDAVQGQQRPSRSNDYEFTIRSRFYTKSQNEPDTNFLGSPIDSYQKLFLRSNFGELGISNSKDIGEPNYFDSYKAFLSLNYEGLELILGNFVAENDFGNILWNPFGKYKGSNSVIVSSMFRKRIVPTLTSMDYGTFRGIALDYNFKLWKDLEFNFLGFVSKANRSATIDTVRNVVTSIYTTELFRTASELAKKNQLDETALFGNVGIRLDFMSFNYSILKLNYDRALQTKSKKYISGFQSVLHSLGLQLRYNDKITFSTEASLGNDDGLGVVCALTYNQRPFATTINFRYFSPNFRSPFGALFGENSYPNNEFGIFCGIEYSRSDVSLQFYGDYFRTLEPTALIQVPVLGSDFYLQSFFTPLANLSTRVRIQRKEKTDYTYNIQKTKQVPFQSISYEFLIENRYAFSEVLLVSHRMDFIYLDNTPYLPNEIGWHTFIDLAYSPASWCDFGIRANLFSTESFSSAIYVFKTLSPDFMMSQPYYEYGYKGNVWCNLKFNDKGINIYLRYYYLSSDAKLSNFILGQITLNFNI
jgi:hypothetical protein